MAGVSPAQETSNVLAARRAAEAKAAATKAANIKNLEKSSSANMPAAEGSRGLAQRKTEAEKEAQRLANLPNMSPALTTPIEAAQARAPEVCEPLSADGKDDGFEIPDRVRDEGLDTLSPGENNHDEKSVRGVQAKLTKAMHGQGVILLSGKYDKATIDAVKQYQREHGLQVHGIVDKQT